MEVKGGSFDAVSPFEKLVDEEEGKKGLDEAVELTFPSLPSFTPFLLSSLASLEHGTTEESLRRSLASYGTV